ncbi:MAG: amidohydrolase [Planctomycetales bacterium]|nr:amidohydrolase [Planctomycetales bacterium]
MHNVRAKYASADGKHARMAAGRVDGGFRYAYADDLIEFGFYDIGHKFMTRKQIDCTQRNDRVYEPSRREFVSSCVVAGTAAALCSADASAQDESAIPIIDSHIHFFDPNRPQGAPYTGPPGVPTEPSFPPRYRKLAVPLGVVGAIKVEASPWVEDNLWALQVCQTDEMIVGVVGNLQPEKPEFVEYLDRFAKDPLFRGIRYGNLWGYDLSQQLDNPTFVSGLKRLADADLVLDSANPNIKFLQAIVRTTDLVPDLRIVVDHLPNLEPTQQTLAEYNQLLDEIRDRPNVFVKLSSVIHPVNGKISKELSPYENRLDTLMQVFGEDRVIFGSDWPNSDGVASIDEVFGVVKQYFAKKPRSVAEKYFWKNSIRAYKWTKRTPNQPSIS